MSRRLENFGDRRDFEKLRGYPRVGAIERGKIGSVERLVRIDRGPEFLVGDDAVFPGRDAGREDRAVDVGRARVGGEVALEDDAGTPERKKGGGVLFRHLLGPHAVPDHDHDVLGFAAVVSSAGSGCKI